MKKIEAIIKPFKLDEVKEALQEAGAASSKAYPADLSSQIPHASNLAIGHPRAESARLTNAG